MAWRFEGLRRAADAAWNWQLSDQVPDHRGPVAEAGAGTGRHSGARADPNPGARQAGGGGMKMPQPALDHGAPLAEARGASNSISGPSSASLRPLPLLGMNSPCRSLQNGHSGKALHGHGRQCDRLAAPATHRRFFSHSVRNIATTIMTTPVRCWLIHSSACSMGKYRLPHALSFLSLTPAQRLFFGMNSTPAASRAALMAVIPRPDHHLSAGKAGNGYVCR